MNRTRIAWSPDWDQLQNYVAPLIRKFGWRLRPLYDEDDLKSEAWLTFQKIQDRYPHVIDPPHFKTIFYGAFARRMMDMQRRASYRPSPVTDVLGEDVAFEDVAPTVEGHEAEADLRMFMETVPDDLRQVVELALLEGRPRGLSPHRISTRLSISLAQAREALSRVRGLFPSENSAGVA